MSRKPESRGACPYCGEIIPKRGVAKHQAQCPKCQEIQLAAESGARLVETLWHLRVLDASYKNNWLDLEMVGTASLDMLDKYLRTIWLECYGHHSMLRIVGWSGKNLGKVRKANSTFETGLVLRHLYGFSTTSETDIKVLGFREGKATTKHPMVMLARNRMPEAVCREWDQPAKWLCLECLYKAEKWGYLFDEHVKKHPHENDGEPKWLVNSPNTGIWDYTGPGEPPD